jgi:hypothetical protein
MSERDSICASSEKPVLITGTEFSKIVQRHTRKSSTIRWAKFKCLCGVEFESSISSVKSGHTTSCGCMSSRNGWQSRTHGKSGCRVYKIWAGMIKRCQEDERYVRRGIVVCQRWRKFEDFYADMGEPPTAKHSLDRHPDNDGNYEPGNVRWATPLEQANNMRTNRKITANGETKNLSQWARELNLDKRVLSLRLKRGWTDQQTIDGTGGKSQKGDGNNSAKLTEAQVASIRSQSGISTRALSSAFGISQSQVRNILNHKHWGHVNE